MAKKIIIIVLMLFLSSCKSEGGIQKQLSEAFGLKNSNKAGTEFKPSKEDQESLANSIQGCPKDSKLLGKPFPRGLMQYCAYKDQKGLEVKHGEYRKWYPSGKLESKGFYADGEIEGVFIVYYDTGQPKSQATYTHGLMNGTFTSFTKEGGKTSVVSYKGGFKDGAYVKYDKSGKVDEKGLYQNDMKNGLWEFYGRDGVLKEKSEFKDDVRHGKSLKYNRNGGPLSQGFYSNNQEIGHWIYFNNDGVKKSEGNFVDGKKHGRWADYNNQGQETRNTFFDYGRKLDSYKVADASKNGGTRGFGKGDIFGEEPTQERPSIYNRPQREDRKPEPLEKEGWNPL